MTDRPRAGARFYKAHGLGNDYLVFEQGEVWRLAPGAIATVCDRWRGPGADGVVLLLDDRRDGVFRLRMFNPDGSEFERSGNGLRILASHLARRALVPVGRGAFEVEVGGERVAMTVHGRTAGVYDVSVEMGRALVGAEAIGLQPEALDRHGRMAGPNGEPLDVVPVRVGNPHLVVWSEPPTDERLAALGPFLSRHPALAGGTNVQLAEPDGAGGVGALVWERGVGRTSASGTSACAVAVAAVRRGTLPPGRVRVAMEGGALQVDVSDTFDVRLRGPVEEVAEGVLADGFVEGLGG